MQKSAKDCKIEMHKNPRKAFIEWQLRDEKDFFEFCNFQASPPLPQALPAPPRASPHPSSLITQLSTLNPQPSSPLNSSLSFPSSLLTLNSSLERYAHNARAPREACQMSNVAKYFPLSIAARTLYIGHIYVIKYTTYI